MAYTGQTPDTAHRPGEWQTKAACLGQDLEVFFSDSSQHEARSLCISHCPVAVRAACLAAIMTAEDGKGRDCRHGIFAGLDGTQRWQLDVKASGCDEEQAPESGRPQCGSAEALEGHLMRGEPVDDRCWSGEVRRYHSNHRRHPVPDLEPDPIPVRKVKELPECGTEQALYLHRRHKQRCTVCDEAHGERITARRRDILADEHLKGGSERGYMIHRRLCEPACEKCTAGALRDRQARLEREGRHPKQEGLTDREQRVRELWEQSLADSEIARRTGISRSGVANIRRRLGLLNAARAGRVVRPSEPPPGERTSTPHERRIYTLWATGASDFDIARGMAVSVPSVRRVRDRLGLLPNLHTGRAAS